MFLDDILLSKFRGDYGLYSSKKHDYVLETSVFKCMLKWEYAYVLGGSRGFILYGQEQILTRFCFPGLVFG